LRHIIDNRTQHLVALAKDGDESALEQLCKVYGPRVLWLVRLRMCLKRFAKLHIQRRGRFGAVAVENNGEQASGQFGYITRGETRYS
jgi:hypothetical protein